MEQFLCFKNRGHGTPEKLNNEKPSRVTDKPQPKLRSNLYLFIFIFIFLSEMTIQ